MAEREASGVARSAQHTIHVLPHAPYLIARFLAPALERVAADADATQLLIITPDTDTTLAIADAARTLSDRSGAPVVPITSAGRGARLLASRVTPAIAATPGTLVSLLKTSAVKLDAVRTVVIAWADELYAAREGESLEVVLGEVSKEASRVVVSDRMTPDVEALVERHLRRASRQGGAATDEQVVASLPIRYVTTSASGRSATLRRLLDDLDPPSVIVVASSTGAADEARSAIASLGYEGEGSIRVETAVTEQASLVVFYDLPATGDEVVKVAATEPAQVVALVTPRQVPALRRLTSGAVEPIDVSRAAAKARAKDERLRAALRAELQSGFPARELMALEPLLSEFDGVEIAAAALRLMERERTDDRTRRLEAEKSVERAIEKPVERAEHIAEPRAERGAERGGDRPPRTGDRPAPRATRSDAAFTRVFLTIGERDGVRAGDLVGAITGESGITGDRVGKLDIRDGHTVAEIASGDVEAVVEKLNGISLKGKRITARIDDRPAGRSRESGRDAGREGGRDSRPPRRSGPSAGGRGGFRDAGRGGPRDAARGGSREGGRPSFGSGRDRPSRGPARGPSRGPSRDRPAGADRGPRRDDDRPRARAGFTDRSDEGRVPRATREREEWTDRADAVRNARRPRRDQT